VNASDALGKAFHFGAGEPPVGTIAVVSLTRYGRTDLVIDVCGHLVVVPNFSLWPAATAKQTMAMPLAPGDRPPALATAFFRNAVVWAERHEQGQIHVFEAAESGTKRVETLGARDLPQVMFGYSSSPVESWGAVAVAWDHDQRRVAGPNLKPTTVHSVVPVVGVCVRDGVPGLLTRPHPYRLAWRIGEGREVLPTSNDPITSVTVCPLLPNVAWVTSTGDFVVYSMAQHAVLMRRQAGDSTT